jgi:uncharacterized protein YhaN
MTISDQPPPTTNDLPAIWPLVIADCQERHRLGVENYGTPLQPFNGREALVDAYQEQLDKLACLRQEIEERRALNARLAQLEADLRAAVDKRDRAQAALVAEREVSDSRQQRIAELEGLASLAACAIDIRLTAEAGAPDLHLLDEALATVSREAKALLGADPHVDARDQPELMRRSEVKA